MNRLEKLPFILGASMAVLVGAIGYYNDSPSADIYKKMILFIVVFYILGEILRKTISKISYEVLKRKHEKLRQEKILREQREREERKKQNQFKGFKIDIQANENVSSNE